MMLFKGSLHEKTKPNDVDFKIMKDIHLQFMKEKCSLDAKLIKLDQEKLELSTKNHSFIIVSIFIYPKLVENDDSHNKHNSACFCLLSIFHHGIC